jgi:hypothetical protein
MGAAGGEQAGLEKATWPELCKLARDHPESGIAFQGLFQPPSSMKYGNQPSLTDVCSDSYIHTRVEDVGQAGSLFASSDNSLPWWRTLFHNACL